MEQLAGTSGGVEATLQIRGNRNRSAIRRKPVRFRPGFAGWRLGSNKLVRVSEEPRCIERGNFGGMNRSIL
jgi:hypothetical protein